MLHIGQQKTATTTIQACLSELRPDLEARGVRYSSAFGKRKAFKLLDLLSRKGDADDRDERKVLRSAFGAELEGSHRKLIVSNENLFTLPRKKIKRLHELVSLRDNKVSVHAYVRRPSEHVISQYSEKIDGFVASDLDKYIDEVIKDGKYNYHEIFSVWAEIFGPRAVKVRLFDPPSMAGGPARDFMSWVGIDTDAITLPRIEAVNQSSDIISIEAMRHMTMAYFRDPAMFDDAFLYDYRAALRGFDDGQRLRITTEQARRLEAAFRDDNHRFAETYLSKPERAALLRPTTGESAAAVIEPNAVLRRALAALGRIPGRVPQDIAEATPASAADGKPTAGTPSLIAAEAPPDESLARALRGTAGEGLIGSRLRGDDLPQAFQLMLRSLAERGYLLRGGQRGRERVLKDRARREKLRRKMRTLEVA